MSYIQDSILINWNELSLNRLYISAMQAAFKGIEMSHELHAASLRDVHYKCSDTSPIIHAE